MSLDLIVFQGTSGCNLNCRYCYLPEAGRRTHQRMPLDVLTRAAALIFRSSLVTDSPTVLWHAGEPLTVGLQNLKASLEVIDRANIYARGLIHSIQTNGTLINQAWCDLFRSYDVKVGVSADGPQFLHDLNRIGWRGQGSHAKTMKGIEALRRNGIPYAGICVLTDSSLDYPDEIYDFFSSEGFSTLGFNLEELEAAHKTTSLSRSKRTEQRFHAFMSRLAERWIESTGSMHIREFEHLASKFTTSRTRPGFTPMQDVAQGLKIVTVRTDGYIVTFSPELATGTKTDPNAFVVGHIDQLEELEDIFADERYLGIRRSIRSGLSKCKLTCEHFDVCGGGWPSNKFFENGSFDSTETAVCKLQVKSLTAILHEQFFTRPEFEAAIQTYIGSRTPAEA